MPIQFRCHNCRQVLSITSKKAGTMVACPSCREPTRVPTMEEVQAALAASRGGQAPSRRGEVDDDQEAVAARSPVPSESAAGSSAPASTGPEPGSELWAAAAAVRERNPWVDEEADAEEEFSINRPPLEESGLDMTPMVDVTFLLLIFFMITAAFNMQKSLPTEPPEPENEGAAQTTVVQDVEQDSVVVGISSNDELTLNDEPIGGLAALSEALQAKAAGGNVELEMTIEADPRCSFGLLVGVLDTGITVGMQRIRRVGRPLDE